MSMPRYNPKRDKSEPSVVAALQALGFVVYRLDTPLDLLVGYNGVTHLVECKTGKAKFNKNQQDFIASWKGSPVVRLSSHEEAMKWGLSVKIGEEL